MMNAILAALLAFGAVMFGGGAQSHAGVQIDPEGRPHTSTATHAASTDQGSMIDPDGRPAR
jgi:hypothetical protein